MATDQGVRYVVSLQDVNVTSGLKNMEGSAMSTERSIASLNDTLRSLAGAFGIGLGLHALVNFGKDAVQGAADYETAVKRIKFASENLVEGGKNIAFITAEADKFKIPLQSATDAYGKFLAMLAGSDIESDRVRKLHDQLLLIGKVKGLGDGQMDAAVMNLGKMLESGSLDARHFRPLEQQLSGIGAFVARELGITVHQLALLRNAGKMTTIDPKVLLSAIEKQAASLEKFLPESTTTIQSQINELDNAWLKFKNDLVYDNLGELQALFGTLKDGVGWLKAHENTIKSVGKAVLTIGEYWLAYKVAVGLVNVALNIYKGINGIIGGQAAVMLTATEAQTAAYAQQAYTLNALTGTLENFSAIQVAQQGFASATNMKNVAGTGALGVLGRTATAASGVISVAVVAMAYSVIKELAGYISFNNEYANAKPQQQYELDKQRAMQQVKDINTIGNNVLNALAFGNYNAANLKGKGNYFNYGIGDLAKQHPEVLQDPEYVNEVRRLLDIKGNKDLIELAKQLGYVRSDDYGAGFANKMIGGGGLNMSLMNKYGVKADTSKGGAGSAGGGGSKITAPNDHITGQRVVTYNITIKEINGIKENNVAEGGEINTKEVAEELRDIIIGIVNDSQIQGDR